MEQNTEEGDRVLLFAHAPGIWIFFFLTGILRRHEKVPSRAERKQSQGIRIHLSQNQFKGKRKRDLNLI